MPGESKAGQEVGPAHLRRQGSADRDGLAGVRRLAVALRFLQSIPLGSAASKDRSSGAGETELVHQDSEGAESQALDVDAQQETGVVRIQGAAFRRVTSRGDRSSEQYRGALLQAGVTSGRVFFSRRLAFPTGVFALLPHERSGDDTATRAGASIDLVASTLGPSAARGGGVSTPFWAVASEVSYARLLQPTWGDRAWFRAWHRAAGGRIPPSRVRPVDALLPLLTPYPSDGALQPPDSFPFRPYDPMALDPPLTAREKGAGQLQLPSFTMTLIPYRTAAEADADREERWREAHPWLSAHRLSIVRLRSAQRALLRAWLGMGAEVSSLALAWVYFEKLVWSRCVDRGNQMVVLAACALLALKFNDPPRGTGSGSSSGDAGDASPSDGGAAHIVKTLLPGLAAALGVSASAVRTMEFPVLARLGFGLHVPLMEVLPHFERLMRWAALDVDEYLGLTGAGKAPRSRPSGTPQPGQGGGAARGGDGEGTAASDSDDGWIYDTGVHYDYRNDELGVGRGRAMGAAAHRPFYAPLKGSAGVELMQGDSMGDSDSSAASRMSEHSAHSVQPPSIPGETGSVGTEGEEVVGAPPTAPHAKSGKRKQRPPRGGRRGYSPRLVVHSG